MSDAADRTELWRLIPLAEFQPPADPAPEAVRSGLHNLWQRLRGDGPHTDGAPADVEMARPSQRLLDWGAPPPDWAGEEMTDAAATLQNWLETDTPGVQTIVQPPVGPLREWLLRWAGENALRLVEPPTPEEILRAESSLLEGLNGETRLFVPRLERCFLRHHNGLDLLRRFLEWVDQKRPRLLVLCDSWAWRYLCQVEQIEAVLGQALTPAPFGEEALGRWLGGAAQKAGPSELTFREATTGKLVLDGAGETAQKDGSAFLRHLAVRSRGNPRVAWEIWRRSLLTAKESAVEEDAQEAAAGDAGYTLWVRPWEQVQLPDLAGGATRLDGMLLYTLLLHGGLSQRLIAALLPEPPSRVAYALRQLCLGGLVEEAEGEWRPTALGYPAVRRFLAQEGFLVDGL